MGTQYKKFETITIWVVLVIFVIRCTISWGDICEYFDEGNIGNLGYCLFGYAGETIGIASIIMICFNKWI